MQAIGNGSQCADTALQPVNNVLAETYGPGSRCVEVGAWTRTQNGVTTASSPLDGSGCYQVHIAGYLECVAGRPQSSYVQ